MDFDREQKSESCEKTCESLRIWNLHACMSLAEQGGTNFNNETLQTVIEKTSSPPFLLLAFLLQLCMASGDMRSFECKLRLEIFKKQSFPVLLSLNVCQI